MFQDELDRADALMQAGEVEAALCLLERLVAQIEKEIGHDSEALIKPLGMLAHALGRRNRPRDLSAEEEAVRKRSLLISDRVNGELSEVSSSICRMLAVVLSLNGRHLEANEYMTRVLAFMESTRKPGFSLASDIRMVGDNLLELGQFEEAAVQYRRALTVLGVADGARLRCFLNYGMGRALLALGQGSEAHQYFAQALAVWSRRDGPQSRFSVELRQQMDRAKRLSN
ncbi:MAG: hypothetical protein U0271_22685 [Polyangiaceae bacterium]